MMELMQIVGFFALAAAVSFAVTLVLMKALSHKRLHALAPGCAVRLRTPDGVYRTRYAGPTRQGLVFAAPLQRDSYVPISVGAPVTVEAPGTSGVLLFRTKVTARDAATHELVLEAPEKVLSEDRRHSKRQSKGLQPVLIEDATAWLSDVSETGMRVLSDRHFPSGERVKIELPSSEEPYFGWVLHCGPNLDGGKGQYVVRIRLESILAPV